MVIMLLLLIGCHLEADTPAVILVKDLEHSLHKERLKKSISSTHTILKELTFFDCTILLNPLRVISPWSPTDFLNTCTKRGLTH